MRYYIAYGSNTPQEMKKRCPDSRFLGIVTLKGFKLLFRYYLTIEEVKSAKTKVMLYEISATDECYLDEYEGYPQLYDKKEVQIRFKGKKLHALIYFMPHKVYGIAPLCLPNADYMNRCFLGYRDAKIPFKQLTDAVLYTADKLGEFKTFEDRR